MSFFKKPGTLPMTTSSTTGTPPSAAAACHASSWSLCFRRKATTTRVGSAGRSRGRVVAPPFRFVAVTGGNSAAVAEDAISRARSRIRTGPF